MALNIPLKGLSITRRKMESSSGPDSSSMQIDGHFMRVLLGMRLRDQKLFMAQ
jgi:hypothetical protein